MQSGCNIAKLLYSGKGCSTWPKVVLFGQSGLIRIKVLVFGQGGCIRAKVVVFLQSG